MRLKFNRIETGDPAEPYRIEPIDVPEGMVVVSWALYSEDEIVANLLTKEQVKQREAEEIKRSEELMKGNIDAG